MSLSGRFEGQANDRQAIIDRIATYGLRVFCTDCGRLHRHYAGRADRLRNLASPCCGARMRQVRWKGWQHWRTADREARREEPALRQPHLPGLDS